MGARSGSEIESGNLERELILFYGHQDAWHALRPPYLDPLEQAKVERLRCYTRGHVIQSLREVSAVPDGR